jgi:hypothetical protein
MNLEQLRVLVYSSFAQTGVAATNTELASALGCEVFEVETGLSELARQRHLVIDEQFRIVMAHPFSSVPLGFSVMGKSTLWWGGCAWDAFALPHLVKSEPEVLIATTCPNCKKALAWNVNSSTPPAGREIAHFLVPTSNMWDDVVHTCGNQRIFCSGICLDEWLAQSGHHKGYVLNLGVLWNLASDWYSGRLDEGYSRREPAEAKEYFRSVGLSGGFWGLND